MKKIIILAVTVCGLLPLTAACSSGGTEQYVVQTATPTTEPVSAPAVSSQFTQSEQIYLQVLHKGLTDNPGFNDTRLVILGHAVCTDWDEGNTTYQTLNDASGVGFNDYDAGFIVGAATDAFCPEYDYLITG